MKKRTGQEEQKAIELYSLPSTWKWMTVNDAGAPLKNAIVDGPFGSNLKVSDYVETGTVPVLTTKNMEGSYDNVRYITEEKLTELKRSTVRGGDILMAKIGSCGKTGIYPSNMPPAMIPANLLKVTVNDHFDQKYIYHYFNSVFFQDALKTITRATAQPAFGITSFKTLPLPFAPLDEQKLIVAEIEKQFSRLDEAVANLKRVKANLKRYKAAVLKAAVEGKITEEWRKMHLVVEPMSELLKRLLRARKMKWEADSPGKKYKELSVADNSKLPELPREWAWVTWDVILSFDKGAFKRGPFGSALKKAIFVKSGYKVYEQYCPINDDCSFARYFITEKKYSELETFSVHARDFLISCSGVTLGRITQVPDEYDKGIINQALLRVRLNNNVIDDTYFKMLFRSPYFQKKMFDNSTGSAIPNVKGVNDLKAIPLPLPPKIEQQAIIKVLEERMSVFLAIENQVDSNLNRAERLRQSILSSAFAGQLLDGESISQPNPSALTEGAA